VAVGAPVTVGGYRSRSVANIASVGPVGVIRWWVPSVRPPSSRTSLETPLSATSAEPAIAVRGLTKRYGAVTAVDGLDLDVRAGETLALLGPNGAGKTTTVECCEGYRSPDAGSVRVLGLDPRRDAARLRPRVGLMLQEGGVYPMARPLEVLRLFAAFHADPLDADRLLERVGLTDARGTRFRDLSGGQKQRLSLALAVIGRPEVVFLDEPTAGLDPAARRLTWQHLTELRAGGVTVVLTTHLLDEAEHLADRVAIVDHGRLVALGTPDELTRSGHDEVEFSAPGGVDVTALGMELGAVVRAVRPGWYAIEAPNEPALIARLAVWLERRDVRIGELRSGRRTLEDVCLRLTGDDEVPAVGSEPGTRTRRRSRGVPQDVEVGP
jgi:ABC-2 type transport system ATP-binding protein